MKQNLFPTHLRKIMDTFDLKMVVWNCRGYSGKKNEIRKFISDYDIVVLTETKFSKEQGIYAPGFKTIAKASRGKSGGVAIMIRSHIEFELIKGWNRVRDEFDVIGIRLINTEIKFNLIAVYRRPYGRICKREWRELLNFDVRNMETVVLGDFNAHNRTWNCEATDINGENLYEAMYDEDLICMNPDTMSRLGEVNSLSSNIDLVFSTNRIANEMECGQLDDTWGSDHFPIEVKLEKGVRTYRKRTNKISTISTQWEVVSKLLSQDLDDKEERKKRLRDKTINPERRYEILIEIIKEAVEVATYGRRRETGETQERRKDKRQSRGEVSWWDQECANSIQQRKEALKKYKKDKDMHSWIEFKRTRAIARKTINKKKREDFDRFCASINKFTSFKYVWNKMKVFKNARKNINWNGWASKSREEEIRREIDKLAPPTAMEQPARTWGHRHREQKIEEDFTMEELDRALRMIRRNSAPGRDGIEYRMVQCLRGELKEILLEIYNEVWGTDWFPTDWKQYQVLFIDKPGKEKVRPISLSSCVGKVFERMVNERIVWWAEKEDKICKEQNGFRRGRSCAENLTRLYADIKSARCKDRYTLVAYLDVTSAYDNVQYKSLIKKLIDLNCPANIVCFLSKWMYNRNVEFIIKNDEKCERVVSKGLPQGAVLSPILYALYTSAITLNIDKEVKVVQFADDIAIYVAGANRNENKSKLAKAVNTIANRLRNIGLELEPKKTVLVEYNKFGLYDKNMCIRIGGISVQNSREAKFLGIWMDNKLNFDKQVQVTRGKMDRANSLMKYLNKKSKGMEVNTALMLYKSLVRSVVDYGSFIYYPNNENRRLKLERGQFAGIRTALGLRNSTPTNVLLAESKVMYIKDRAGFLARNFLSKNICYGERDLIDSVTELERTENIARLRQPAIKKDILSEAWIAVRKLEKKLGPSRKFEILDMNFEDTTYIAKVDINTGEYRKIKDSTDKELKENIDKKHGTSKDAVVVYTDGSKREEGSATGASIVFQNQEVAYNIGLPKDCSIYTAEAFAIKSALEVVYEDKSNKGKDIIILSDCKSVLQRIESNIVNVYTNKYICDIRAKANQIEKEFKVKVLFIWVPAHSGIHGNEIADILAKEATKGNPREDIIVPLGDYRQKFIEEMWDKTIEKIKNESNFKGKFYMKNFYKEKDKKPWFTDINKERYFVTLINRIRTNHYNLKTSLERKGYINDPMCECEREEESLDHVVWRCERYREERKRLVMELRKRGIVGETAVIEVIKKCDWNTFECMLNFVKSIKRII